MEFDSGGRGSTVGPVDIIFKQSGAWLVVAVQQRTQGVDNGGLTNVIRADNNVQTRFKRYVDLFQLPKVANGQRA